MHDKNIVSLYKVEIILQGRARYFVKKLFSSINNILMRFSQFFDDFLQKLFCGY